MSGPSDADLIATLRDLATALPLNFGEPLTADAVKLCNLAADRLAALTAAGDDGEPISPDWLRSVGFIDFHEETEHCDAFLSFWLERREHNAALLSVHWAKPSNPQGHFWRVNGFTCPKRAIPTTRGHVRRLLAALGVPPNGPAPTKRSPLDDDHALTAEDAKAIDDALATGTARPTRPPRRFTDESPAPDAPPPVPAGVAAAARCIIDGNYADNPAMLGQAAVLVARHVLP